MENKYLLLSPLLHKDKCLRKTIVTPWMCLEERGRQYASLPRDRDLYQDPGLARLGAGHASRPARPRMASLHNLCDRGEIILLQQIPLMGNTLKYLYLLSSDLWSKSMTFSTPVTTSTSGTEDTRPWCTDTTSEARHVTRDTWHVPGLPLEMSQPGAWRKKFSRCSCFCSVLLVSYWISSCNDKTSHCHLFQIVPICESQRTQ